MNKLDLLPIPRRTERPGALNAFVVVMTLLCAPACSSIFKPDPPQFKAVAQCQVKTEQGERIDCAEVMGDVNVLIFWTHWCKGCKLEIRHANKIWRTYKRDPRVRVLLVGTEAPEDELNMAELAAVKRTLNVHVPMVFDVDRALLQQTQEQASHKEFLAFPLVAVVDKHLHGVVKQGYVTGFFDAAATDWRVDAIETLKAKLEQGESPRMHPDPMPE
jgi:hypothetical protein